MFNFIAGQYQATKQKGFYFVHGYPLRSSRQNPVLLIDCSDFS